MNLAAIKKIDFFPASFKIQYQNQIIYFDPLNVTNPQKADYVFISHNHADHFSMNDIKKVCDSHTIIISPININKHLKDFNSKITKYGDSFMLNNIIVEVVPSYNMAKSGIHKKNEFFNGYIIHLGQNRIYFAGDTDFIPEMKAFKNITLAFLPVGEGKTAMNPVQAANAVNTFLPQFVVPMHFELNNQSEYLFKFNVNKSVNVVFLHCPDSNKHVLTY